VRQQTRGYNAEKRETYLLRDKENDAGYRYFPEPDLPPLLSTPAFVEEIARSLPELPEARRALREESSASRPTPPGCSRPPEDRRVLRGDACSRARPGGAARSRRRELHPGRGAARRAHDGLEATFPVEPAQVAELLGLVEKGTISGKQAKEVLRGDRRAPKARPRTSCASATWR
jgi:aspartyl-tRNA(Asn)/glutamyl-tRNA(Gln) amidotransferase subunit B